jgi:hypothetical protein
MKGIFSNTLELLWPHISAVIDVYDDTRTVRILFSGILGECPYCICFIREPLPQNTFILNTADKRAHIISSKFQDSADQKKKRSTSASRGVACP